MDVKEVIVEPGDDVSGKTAVGQQEINCQAYFESLEEIGRVKPWAWME